MRTEDKQAVKALMSQMIDESGDESLSVLKKALVDFKMYEKATNLRDIEVKYRDSPEAKYNLEGRREGCELSGLMTLAGVDASPKTCLLFKKVSSLFEDIGIDISMSDIESIKEDVDKIFN